MTDKINDDFKVHIHDEDRGNWSHKREFLLSCIGYAVGTGNVWRFPYLTYKSGGGAFLLPYLLMLFLCGIPLFFMEIVIGQFSSTGCVMMFRMAPIFKGTGYAMAIVNIIATCYYSVIISYPLLFVAHSFGKTIPWESCDNHWNTDKCISVHNSTNANDFEGASVTAADEFFNREILRLSSGIHEFGVINWPLFFCLIVTWSSITACIFKGVKTVGKVVYFTALFPFLVLIILFFRGITLQGASKGIEFYIKPKWESLLDLRIWSNAAIQIFYSLGPGWGGIVNMASYNQFHNNALQDSILVPIINSSTSIFAGFIVFSVLGFLSDRTGRPVATVATAGPGLAFVTYPEALSLMPLTRLWAVLFFLMLFFLGLDSVFVELDCVLSSMADDFHRLRKHKSLVTSILCFCLFLISCNMATNGGMYYLQIFDYYSASISVIFICIIESLIVVVLYGMDRFTDDIFFMIGRYPNKVLIFVLKYVTPSVLVFIFFTSIIFNSRVTYGSYIYPDWAIALGWCSCGISVIFIPLYMIYMFVTKTGTPLHILKVYTKAYDWTPAAEDKRLLYENFLKEKEIEKLEMQRKKIENT